MLLARPVLGQFSRLPPIDLPPPCFFALRISPLRSEPSDFSSHSPPTCGYEVILSAPSLWLRACCFFFFFFFFFLSFKDCIECRQPPPVAHTFVLSCKGNVLQSPTEHLSLSFLLRRSCTFFLRMTSVAFGSTGNLRLGPAPPLEILFLEIAGLQGPTLPPHPPPPSLAIVTQLTVPSDS